MMKNILLSLLCIPMIDRISSNFDDDINNELKVDKDVRLKVGVNPIVCSSEFTKDLEKMQKSYRN